MKTIMLIKGSIIGMCFFLTLGGLKVKAQSIDTLIFTWEYIPYQGIISEQVSIYTTAGQPFTVYWGDGSMNTYMSTPTSDPLLVLYPYVSHTYSNCGTYTVTVVGSPTCNIIRTDFATRTSRIINVDLSKCNNLYAINTCKSNKVSHFSVDYNKPFVDWIVDMGLTWDGYPNINVQIGAISCDYEQLTLIQLDTIKSIIPKSNPYAMPQNLESQIITIGDTVDWSSEAIIKGTATLFEVFRMDSTCDPKTYKPVSVYGDFRIPYILPVNQGDYTEANGVFIFHNQGEYKIRMMNTKVKVHSMFLPSTNAEVYQEITVLPQSNLNGVNYPIIYDQFCKGGVYNKNGFNETTEGIFTRTVPKIDQLRGCDSTITLYLSYYPIDTTEIDDQMCKGDVYSKNGFNENKEGIYHRTAKNINGCDSVIKLNLSYYPDIDTTVIDAKICKGGEYNQNGFKESREDVFTRIEKSVIGCDSVIKLNLSYYPEIDTTVINAQICPNSVYTQNGFDEKKEGIYHRTEKSINGCDSVVELRLLVKDVLSDTVTVSICQGETYNYNGKSLGVGEYDYKYTTSFGCDSLVRLNIVENPKHNTTIYESIICGESYNFYGKELTKSGTYTHTLISHYGCDSIIELILNIPSSLTELSASICEDNSYNFAGKDLKLAGVYYDTLQSNTGCDSIIELTLSVELMPEFEITTIGVLCNGKEVELTANINNVSYFWSTSETTQSIRVIDEGFYSVKVNTGLCESSKEIEVNCPCKMRLPNVFTPKNGEYSYIPEYEYELNSFSMVIYDRWGAVVFQTNNFTSWDGKTKLGQDASAGVYFCVIDYSSVDSPTKKCTAQSSITLIR